MRCASWASGFAHLDLDYRVGGDVVSDHAPTVTFHIGPGKTGTTSIQTALHASADGLQTLGATVPRPGFGVNGHLLAAFDFLDQHRADVLPTAAVPLVRMLAPTCAGAWEDLVAKARAASGWTVISQEVLSFLTEPGVRALAAEFPGTRVRAVAMYRPVSKLLPSTYQQQARLALVPSFEVFARRCIAALLRGGDHEFAWMDSAWLRRTWRTAGVELVIVDSVPDLSDASLTELMAQLLPTDVPVPTVQRENPGLSAFGVAVWRDHLERTRPRHFAPTMAVLETFVRVDPWATDAALGGTLEMREEVGPLLDIAFPSGSADAGSDRERAGARLQLAAALDSDRPLTIRTPGSGLGQDEHRDRTAAGLARRQRQLSALWAAGALLRKVQRRPPPLRADWGRP